jgi:hypothetical protein
MTHDEAYYQAEKKIEEALKLGANKFNSQLVWSKVVRITLILNWHARICP